MAGSMVGVYMVQAQTVAGLSAYYTRCCGLSEALLVSLKPSLLHTFITTWHHNALGVVDTMGVVQ